MSKGIIKNVPQKKTPYPVALVNSSKTLRKKEHQIPSKMGGGGNSDIAPLYYDASLCFIKSA